jgi:hypothetical protein
MKRRTRLMTRFAAVSLIGLIASEAAYSAEETTLNAFATWQGRGQIYPTGEKEATFVGAFSGVLYLESGEGPLDAGYMICPVVVDLDLDKNTQAGKGRCTISGTDGARAFSTWACTGPLLKGCDGQFTFTGGTERLAGLTGGGPIKLRSRLHEMTESPGNTVQHEAAGIAIWRELKVKLP